MDASKYSSDLKKFVELPYTSEKIFLMSHDEYAMVLFMQGYRHPVTKKKLQKVVRIKLEMELWIKPTEVGNYKFKVSYKRFGVDSPIDVKLWSTFKVKEMDHLIPKLKKKKKYLKKCILRYAEVESVD